MNIYSVLQGIYLFNGVIDNCEMVFLGNHFEKVGKHCSNHLNVAMTVGMLYIRQIILVKIRIVKTS